MNQDVEYEDHAGDRCSGHHHHLIAVTCSILPVFSEYDEATLEFELW